MTRKDALELAWRDWTRCPANMTPREPSCDFKGGFSAAWQANQPLEHKPITPGAYWRSAKSAPLAKRILVACSRGDVMIAMRVEYGGWMRDSDGSNIFDVVTHWRPIPDPPKSETEQPT